MKNSKVYNGNYALYKVKLPFFYFNIFQIGAFLGLFCSKALEIASFFLFSLE